VESVWAPRIRISRRLSAKSEENLENGKRKEKKDDLVIQLSFGGRNEADP
jgi:hypothetical protein